MAVLAVMTATIRHGLVSMFTNESSEPAAIPNKRSQDLLKKKKKGEFQKYLYKIVQ
jgi:hypothetical protein